MTEPSLQKYFQDDPPSLFDQINGEQHNEYPVMKENC